MQQQRRRPPLADSPVTQNNHTNRPVRQSSRSAPPSQCFGCNQPMYNQFISNVLDHLWHPECVRCFICRCVLNEQCYSREGKLYCKDDFIKKYIHRCFACQNLVQSHEFIRRVRAGRIYHAACFVCSKCKRELTDDDITVLLKPEGATLDDSNCMCQACLNPSKITDETTSSSNEEENKTKENGVVNGVNGKASPTPENKEEKPITNGTSHTDNHVDEQQSMEVDEPPPQVTKPVTSPVKESSPYSSPATPPAKSTGRQSKVRQSTSSNGSKRSPAKAKTTPVSRQKQTTGNERKGRSPATRSKASAGTPSASQRRSSNRRTTKSTRYRKRSFSSGSDEEETEDEDDNDTDFTEEDNMLDNEHETNHSPAVKAKPSTNSNEKKLATETMPPVVSQMAAIPPLPAQTALNPSLLSQTKMSEPLSLLSGLAANPMSISSIMKPDAAPSFMPPNFNPAFPNPAQFLPPGFPLQPRLPMPPPPIPTSSSSSSSTAAAHTSQPPASTSDANRTTNGSDTDSLDRSSSPSQMDVSTNAEPGTPARPPSPSKGSRPSTSTTKPSALSSLLEFGTIPPSTLGDIRPTNAPPNPFPFPFITPGPGVPFSPQAAAGMATFYRPPFGTPAPQSTAMPLDMSQSNSNTSKQKSDVNDNEEVVSQNLLDDSSASSSSPKKKARKSNARSKSKTKKNDTDGENDIDDDNPSPPPPPAENKKKRKKKLKPDATENGNTNDSEEGQVMNGNANNHPHNLLAQMGLLNSSFMPPPAGANGATTNGKTPTPQQAQLAALYNMAPHFAAYNAFPGAFNPAFAAAYAGGFPPPYGFHPAFGAPTPGQPFPFMPPTATPPGGSPFNNDDKTSSTNASETKSGKSRSKANTNGEKKKASTPRSNKKKSLVPPTDLSLPMEGELGGHPTASEATPPVANTPDSTSTPTRRHMSGTESDDPDEPQLHSQTTNGKSGNESDDSACEGDQSLNPIPSASSLAAPEKKGARTTIKPQQLDILCKAYESCSKPNKSQREQLVAETGLNLRVIQVWFQNRRSKERKGKAPKEKGAALDDDEIGDDSQPSLPPTTTEPGSVNETET
ncbi:unnamed protein product [Adineta ricciae]|uniref:Uncharacterized protein n=1 Tax=Adineta ricciae TaxID=249248 RepID=A0A813WXN0_ADIRI|nr:unnamed protein product [Adineta ricciae]CAF0905380.1 unnamed protein product [Adineta ricciae]